MSAIGHILICDDQFIIHETIRAYLKADGFAYDSAYDGEEALKKAYETKPDLIILDIMMPKINGIEVCRTLRKTTDVPIIMLTAKGEEIDKILGLELGADDYIVKPFSPREVVARVKTVLRRRTSQRKENEPIIRYEGLDVNISSYEVRLNGEIVHFTPKEVEILYLLASHPGQVFDREQIIQKVWGDDYFGDTRSVDTQIKRIRQKLSCEDVKWSIKSIYGVGYKFEVQS
ncbi:response regulator transcription factor [Geosporobacter ferrireducens]|uniref:Stage 0 sporulation protein A homolog n=1 Tax=Geosporobacter ferrireducens TaxID=1424294 RepID=A0A1D8GEP8_9FIRM|nr:response regulator transcription factor [Geosporobacter ferrireducens]AOT69368.1 DNA-binding response regulator [Geosporobacter ferrireducens]MTI57057.1 response regulator transcription factor [Geosporobacter ferrireducens]